MLRTEDEANAATLSASAKDRAEHVMLVDLARNDVNRVCKPETVKVDYLMRVEKFSHVMHLTSQISGMLRQGKNRSVQVMLYCVPAEIEWKQQVRCIPVYFPCWNSLWRTKDPSNGIDW